MDEDAVRWALHDAGIDAGEVEPIGDGWANWTFLVDKRLVVRFPRNDEVADATRRGLRLLPALSSRVHFAVPVPAVVGDWDDRPFFGYELLEGRPLSEADLRVAPALGEMLAELHAFPIGAAAELLGTTPPENAWQEHYEQLWPVIEEVVLPELDPPLARSVRRNFSRMVEHPPAFPTCLIHNDLGPVHVLIGNNGDPIGIIDFEDAWLGDPATDLTPLVACLGRGALPQLVAGRELGERLEERLRFYRWMGSIHAIIYGVREHVLEERLNGLRELPRRLPPD